MRIRQGFVSNSSSASFIVRWKFPDNKKITSSLESAKTTLIPNWLSNEEDQGDYQQMIEALDQTTDNGIFYETSFFTAMFNDMRDFGPHAALFLMELAGNGFTFETELVEGG